jgi:hypothetical protein
MDPFVAHGSSLRSWRRSALSRLLLICALVLLGAAMSRPATAAGNLLRNSGFEQDANGDGQPDFWRPRPSFTRSSTMSYSGQYSARHYADGSTAYVVSQRVNNLTSGASYRVSCWVKSLPANDPPSTNSATFTFEVRWRDADGNSTVTNRIARLTDETGGQWVELSQILVAPPDTAAADVRQKLGTLGYGIAVYVDKCYFGPP